MTEYNRKLNQTRVIEKKAAVRKRPSVRITLGDADQEQEQTEIEALLKAGGDVNAPNFVGLTPLHRAAWKIKDLQVVEAILKAGGDIKSRSGPLEFFGLGLGARNVREWEKDVGWTPLHFAAWNNENPTVVEALLKAGGDIKARSRGGRTPLHVAACGNENPAMIEALLKADRNVEAQDENGWIPLHFAVWNNKNSAVIEALLKSGGGCNARDKEGVTPLLRAAGNDNLAVVEALLKAGGDVKVRSEGGWTPLHYAAMYNPNPAVIEALLKADGDVNLKTGTSVKAQNENNVTKRREEESARMFLMGIKIQNKDGVTPFKEGVTPLHMAVVNTNPAVIKTLLKAGGDVNARNEEGWTPLHVAAMEGKNPAIIDILLRAGTNPNVKDNKGKIPIDYIDEGGNNRLSNTRAYWVLNDARYNSLSDN